MPIPFSCPHCGIKTLVDDQYAGRHGACAACAKPITVPYATQPTGDSVDAAGSRVPTSRGTSPGWIILIVGGSLLACAACLLLIFALAFPVIRAARAATLRQRTVSNLERILQAMNEYRVDHGTYPPAYVADANGVPMHSWRVLLLRYLGEPGLYEEYNFDLPWDQQDPSISARIPEIFTAPADESALGNRETSYLVIVGPETPFPGTKTTVAQDFTDGVADTIMIVECHGSGIDWMKPADLEFKKMGLTINAQGREIRSSDPLGAHAITADGTVHLLRTDAPPEQVSAAITAKGSDVVDWRLIED